MELNSASSAETESSQLATTLAGRINVDTLFEKHSDWAVALARRIANGHSAEARRRLLPRQIEQAALIALWDAARRYDGRRGTFRPFATIKIRGGVLDELRACSLFGSRNQSQEPLRLFVADDPREDISAQLRAKPTLQADQAALSELIEGLSIRQRECLMLRYGEGLSVKETAAVLGVISVVVWNLEQQALRILCSGVPGFNTRTKHYKGPSIL